MNKLAAGVACIAFLLAALAIVGSWDAEEQEAESKYYCKMVHEGSWPDYNGLAKQGKCP